MDMLLSYSRLKFREPRSDLTEKLLTVLTYTGEGSQCIFISITFVVGIVLIPVVGSSL